MNNRTYIGIDPGKSGGIGIIFSNGDPGAYAMPETERDLWELLCELRDLEAKPVAVLERVSSSPQMGVVSAFTFGEGYGHLRMGLVAAGIPFEAVAPSKWMAHFGLRRQKDEAIKDKKNRAKALAQERFPSIKITHANAEALLLADYARLHSTL